MQQDKNQSHGLHTVWLYLHNNLEMMQMEKWRKDGWVLGVTEYLVVEGK